MIINFYNFIEHNTQPIYKLYKLYININCKNISMIPWKVLDSRGVFVAPWCTVWKPLHHYNNLLTASNGTYRTICRYTHTPNYYHIIPTYIYTYMNTVYRQRHTLLSVILAVMYVILNI